MFQQLLDDFRKPAAEFGPFPFYLLNDELDEKELARQLADYRDKGIGGVILHPRTGLPRDIPYLSDRFMHYIRFCLTEIRNLGMTAGLYDEAMYPSGSAHGLVVQGNPEYASRLLLEQKAADAAGKEAAEAVFALRFRRGKLADYRPLEPGEACPEGFERFEYLCGYTGGHIRGLYEDEDDGGPNAPPSTDLLNPDAIEKFLSLTYDRYRDAVGEFFGSTVIGIFTDEPCIQGRGPKMNGGIVWTPGFLRDFEEAGGRVLLPLLFHDCGEESVRAQRIYRRAVYDRLSRVYYAALSKRCEDFGVALMGHPQWSAEIGLQRYFHIPGQDIVWRMVTPENNLLSPDSPLGKCSSDAARHLGARRNSNEALGAYGDKNNPWKFSATEMMWVLNWLLVRGVNMIIPHAFYYSVRTPLQSNERPPDAGPNNIWWDHYAMIASFIARLCMLNTGSLNTPEAAVLASSSAMPYRPAAPLYENGIDFNYIDEDTLYSGAEVHDGKIHISGYEYPALLIDESLETLKPASDIADDFARRGVRVYQGSDFLAFMKAGEPAVPERFEIASRNVRRVHLRRGGVDIYLFANECGPRTEKAEGLFSGFPPCLCVELDPYTGEPKEVGTLQPDGSQSLRVAIEPYHIRIFAFDASRPPVPAVISRQKSRLIPLRLRPVKQPAGRKAWEPLYYRGGFDADIGENISCRLDFDEIKCLAEVTVNGAYAGPLIFKPFSLDISRFVRKGSNRVEIKIIPGPESKFGSPGKYGYRGARLCVSEPE